MRKRHYYRYPVLVRKIDGTILIKGRTRTYYIRPKKAKTRRNKNNNLRAKVGGDFSANENLDFKLVSEFLNKASEDILLEIFLRLRNCRFAILFGSICRRWHSVISHPKFIPNFIRHHRDQQDRYSLPYTIIFRRTDVLTFRGVECYQPFCKLFSEESKFLHEKVASSYLDFMPSPMIIRASFDDLLLVSPGSRLGRDYYICNPLTKHWFQLPETPSGCPIGFALVCMPDSSNEQSGFSIDAQYQYKVVLIHRPEPLEEDQYDRFRVTIFCSKTGQWSRSYVSYPRPKEIKFNDCLDVVNCNGILYWRQTVFTFDRIVALDLFDDQCRVIDLPDDFECGWQNSYGIVHLGGVRGELRLFQVFEAPKDCLVMKVWELNCKDYESTTWVLVHKISMERANSRTLVGLAVHPIDGDIVYMIWGDHVFQYKIMEKMYEEVGKLQVDPHERFSSFLLVHPAWPTPVPSRPPTI